MPSAASQESLPANACTKSCRETKYFSVAWYSLPWECLPRRTRVDIIGVSVSATNAEMITDPESTDPELFEQAPGDSLQENDRQEDRR